MITDLNCRSVQAALWDFTAGALEDTEREHMASHLRNCRDCAHAGLEVKSVRTGLAALPTRKVPPLVATRLAIIGSRERSRMLRRRDMAARIKETKARVKLVFDNLLRPFAFPAAGGLLASLLCFVAIVDTLHYHPEWTTDIPVGLFTKASLSDLSPFSVGTDVIGVQLTVDPNGAVSDFELPSGNVSAEEMKEIGNLVLFSTFKPATAFGQPVTGKIRMDIYHINIRG